MSALRSGAKRGNDIPIKNEPDRSEEEGESQNSNDGKPTSSLRTEAKSVLSGDLTLDSIISVEDGHKVGKRLFRKRDRPFGSITSTTNTTESKTLLHEPDQHKPRKVAKHEFWISCRFCANVFSEKCGISKVMDHEEDNHPKEVAEQEKSPFYKIIKINQMNIDVYPTHPLVKKILDVAEQMKKNAEEALRGHRAQNYNRGRQKMHTVADVTCSKCNRNCRFPSFLRAHEMFCGRNQKGNRGRRRDYLPEEITCSKCDIVFQSPSIMRLHFIRCGRNPKGYRGRQRDYLPDEITCSKCDGVFQNPSMMRLHFKRCGRPIGSHRGRRRRDYLPEEITCSKCSIVFQNPSMMRLHFIRCGRPDGRKMRKFTRFAIQTCPICGKGFKYPDKLRVHLQTCGSDSLSSETFKPSANWQTSPTCGNCPRCRQPFKFASVLRQHLKFCSIPPQTPEPVRRLMANDTTCSFCHRTFLYPSILWQHVKTCPAEANSSSHLNEQTSSLPQRPTNSLSGQEILSNCESSSSNEQVNYLHCELCNHVSMNRFDMMTHRNIVHKICTPPVGSNTTSININELTNNSQGNIMPNGHELANEEEEQFINPNPLEINVGDNNHTCGICFRQFATSGRLNLHQSKSHIDTAKKRFKCTQCPATFASYSTRRVHIQKHKGIVKRSYDKIIMNGGYTCRYCPIILGSKGGRTMHENKFHPKTASSAEIINDTPVSPVSVSNEVDSSNPAKSFVQCRFCDMICVSLVGRKLHEKYIHKDELAELHEKENSSASTSINLKVATVRPAGQNVLDPAKSFVQCRFCEMLCANSVGRHLHEKYIHKEELAELHEKEKSSASTTNSNLKVATVMATGEKVLEILDRVLLGSSSGDTTEPYPTIVKSESANNGSRPSSPSNLVVISSYSEFECDLCETTLRNASALAEHKMTVHQVDSHEVDPLLLSETESMPHECHDIEDEGITLHYESTTNSEPQLSVPAPTFDMLLDDDENEVCIMNSAQNIMVEGEGFSTDFVSSGAGPSSSVITTPRKFSTEMEPVADKKQRCLLKCILCKQMFKDKISHSEHVCVH